MRDRLCQKFPDLEQRFPLQSPSQAGACPTGSRKTEQVGRQVGHRFLKGSGERAGERTQEGRAGPAGPGPPAPLTQRQHLAVQHPRNPPAMALYFLDSFPTPPACVLPSSCICSSPSHTALRLVQLCHTPLKNPGPHLVIPESGTCLSA